MEWQKFPASASDVAEHIAAAQREGIGSVAKLAGLSLWLAGLKDPPHESYPGPEGSMPLDYLQRTLQLIRTNREARDDRLPVWNVDADAIRQRYADTRRVAD